MLDIPSNVWFVMNDPNRYELKDGLYVEKIHVRRYDKHFWVSKEEVDKWREAWNANA